MKRTFCPPKERYDPKLNADGRYGRPLPRLGELICIVQLYQAWGKPAQAARWGKKPSLRSITSGKN